MRIFLGLAILFSLIFGNAKVYDLPQNSHVHEQFDELGQKVNFEHTHTQVQEPLFMAHIYEEFYDSMRLSIKPEFLNFPKDSIPNSIFRPPIA